jgi:hypothetical protein
VLPYKLNAKIRREAQNEQMNTSDSTEDYCACPLTTMSDLLLPPLPKFHSDLLEQIDSPHVRPPYSHFEAPSRLAIIGEHVYMMALSRALFMQDRPEKLITGPLRCMSDNLAMCGGSYDHL